MLERRIVLAALVTLVACKAPHRRTDQPVNQDEEGRASTTEIRSTPTTLSGVHDASSMQLPVEGRIVVGNVDYALGKDKVRVTIGPSLAIVDRSGEDATVVDVAHRRYRKAKIADLKEQPEEPGKDVRIDKTGKTSLVSGHDCEEWTLTGPEGEVKACVVRAAPGFDLEAASKLSGVRPPAWLDRIVDEGYAPLRVAIGQTVAEWTQTPVDQGDWQAPKGFHEMK